MSTRNPRSVAPEEDTPAPAVMAIGEWRTNGELIADVARLGYLRKEWATLDPTYGMGTFWTHFRPDVLRCHDLDPAKAPHGPMDAAKLDYSDGTFEATVLDPPYKLNGTSSAPDERYGVAGEYASRGSRHSLMADMLTEAARVTRRGGIVLLKCQDQVNGGKVRWQTDEMTSHAATLGLVKVDALLFRSYRAQPHGRSQQHARRNYSTLLVFEVTGCAPTLAGLGASA